MSWQSGYLEGEHASHITREGLTIFPRIEALLATPTSHTPPPRTRVSSGVVSLDAMFGGGIPAATVTALVGPSGAGKTTLGLQSSGTPFPFPPDHRAVIVKGRLPGFGNETACLVPSEL